MRYSYEIPVLWAGNTRHVDSSPIFQLIMTDFLTFLDPSPFPWSTRPIISIFKIPNNVHQVCTESYAVGLIDEYIMMVNNHTDLCCTRTTPSITHMTSPIQLLLVNSATNLGFAFSLYRNRKVNIKFVSSLST